MTNSDNLASHALCGGNFIRLPTFSPGIAERIHPPRLMRSCFQIFPKSCAVSPATFQRRNVYSSIVFTRPERCSLWTPMAFSARLSETISSAISPKKAIQQTVVLLFQNNKNPVSCFASNVSFFGHPNTCLISNTTHRCCMSSARFIVTAASPLS